MSIDVYRLFPGKLTKIQLYNLKSKQLIYITAGQMTIIFSHHFKSHRNIHFVLKITI